MSLFQPSYTDRKGVHQRSKTWWIQFRDHTGARKKIRGLADRRATEKIESRIVDLVHARACGATASPELRRWCDGLPEQLRETLAGLDLLDRRQIAAAKPLTDHLDSWKDHLKAKGTGARQIDEVHRRAKRVVDACGFKTLAAVAAEPVERCLRKWRESKDKDGNPDGIGARTSNHYLQGIREFMGWTVRTGLAVEDPLRVLRPMNAACDRRRERRALTPDELRALLTVAETAAEFEGVPGKTRAVLYRVAAETGLRFGELRALVVADLDLADEQRASVRVRAAAAKNRRDARLPLRPGAAEALKNLVDKALPMASVFGIKAWSKGADAIRADMALAEIPEKDAAGRVVDFHSLRVTFATNLARARVPLQLAQRLMRHSDPRLTSSVYTILTADDERDAVAALPQLALVGAPGTADAAVAGR